jgi:uncharacterized protein
MTDPSTSALSRDERKWAAVAHLAALVGIVIPFVGALLGPFIVWLATRNRFAFAAGQAREALDFQLTVFIAALLSAALVLVGIGVPLLVSLCVVDLVFITIAALRAGDGIAYRYPLSWRALRRAG